MAKTPKEPDKSSVEGRMSGSPRRVVQELEIEVTLRHVIKLQVTSPLTEDMAKKEAIYKVCTIIRDYDNADLKFKARIL